MKRHCKTTPELILKKEKKPMSKGGGPITKIGTTTGLVQWEPYN
jgi:hypothetical protein